MVARGNVGGESPKRTAQPLESEPLPLLLLLTAQAPEGRQIRNHTPQSHAPRLSLVRFLPAQRYAHQSAIGLESVHAVGECYSCRGTGGPYGPVTVVTDASNCCLHRSACEVFRLAEFNSRGTACPGWAGMSAVPSNGLGSIVNPIAMIADAGSSATHAFDFDLVRKSAASCGVWNTRR